MSWNLWGHEWAEALLKRHIANGSTRHAYMFTGAPGIGRRSLALAFIRAINCLEPPEPGEYCGQCRNCRQLGREQHPDLFVGQSEGPGGNLKVDTIRQIQHELNLLPYTAQWRTAVFLRFEEANNNAQNALLKTLEEPPSASKLILTASNENALLPTIASRCEVLRLRPMSPGALSSLLSERNALDAENASRIAHLSGGRVGFALRLAENPDEAERVINIARELLELLGEGIVSRFAYAAAFRETKKRGELREIFQIWQTLLRDLLLLSIEKESDREEDSLSFTDLRAELRERSRDKDPRVFRESLSAVNQSLAYLSANVNLQLLTENLLLDLPRI